MCQCCSREDQNSNARDSADDGALTNRAGTNEDRKLQRKPKVAICVGREAFISLGLNVCSTESLEFLWKRQ